MPGFKLLLRSFFRKILDVAESLDRSALLRVRVDSGISLIVDPIHPVQSSGKLVLLKTGFIICSTEESHPLKNHEKEFHFAI